MRRALSVLIMLGAAAGHLGWAAESGPVGYWRFDRSEPLVADQSGHGHDARLSGGRIVNEEGRAFLRLDGKARVEVPAAPDLALRRGFTLETRIRPTDLSDGRGILFKQDEYLLRLDWPKESSQLSFFVKAGAGWESRVSAFKLPLDTWYHLVASWDGAQLLLWVNGLPYAMDRRGDPAAPTANPLLIGTADGFAPGFVGDLEYVKIYARVLTPSEVIQAACAAGGRSAAPALAVTEFDFRQGDQGWLPREGARATSSPAGLDITTAVPGSLVMHDHLNVAVAQRDFLVLRLAVREGSSGALVFVTSRGAGRLRFATRADGQLHTYVVEPWQDVNWGGDLLALGLVPAETTEAHATLESIRLTEEPSGAGEVSVLRLFPEAMLPRAGRTETLVARLQNSGGPAHAVAVRLEVPPGVELLAPAVQEIERLGYLEERQLTWPVRAGAPLSGECRVAVSGAGLPSVALAASLTFLPGLELPAADYVPEPRPVSTGKYRVWTHYCPLWKQGTHTGWQAIEPYPERKPVLGWYNEGTPEVADWHIKYWLEHGISGVVYCWYRSSINEPVRQNLGHAIHDGLLKAKYLPQIGFAIMWENGCGAGVGSSADLLTNVFPYWLDTYFTHPSYLKIDGKPVLYVWVPGNVTKHLGGSEAVRNAFAAMRQACRERGLGGLYLVGCMGGADREALEQMAREGWDASSAYGNGWSYPAKLTQVGDCKSGPYADFVRQQEALWKAKTEMKLLPDITAAMMGWDSRPWNETPFFWADNTAETFRDLCRGAKAAMDAKASAAADGNTVIFCCWNEFGEGHYIEPTRGYGFSYLDAIRDVFAEAPGAHTDLAPQDVGRGPYDSWYQQFRAAAPAHDPGTSAWSGAALAAWSGFMGVDQAELKDGVLRLRTTSVDPALSSPALRIRAGRFAKVVVEMRVSQPGDAQLFWATSSYPHVEERMSLHVKAVADGEFHPYTFAVATTAFWGGCLTSMRLDPAEAPGVTVEIRAIRLE